MLLFTSLGTRGICALAVAASLTCDSPTAGEARFEGAFTLVEFNGERLPVVNADLPPPRGGGPGENCNQVINFGSLTLDGEFGVFQLRYDVSNSCTGAFLSRIDNVGSFAVSGQKIAFVVPAIPPGEPNIEFGGMIAGETVVVDLLGDVLVFTS